MPSTFTVSDGTTTVTLAGSNASVVDYKPLAPESGSVTVQETAVIYWNSFSTGRTAITNLNRLFEAARLRQKRQAGTRIYVNFQLNAGDSTYRAEVMDGTVEIPNESLGYAEAANALDEVSITWTRTIWEGPETQIAISNGNGTNNTSGLTITNHASSASNYFTVAAGVVTGDAPCNIRIELTNSQATSLGYYIIGLLQNSASWTSANNTFQGESAAYSPSGSAQSSGSASGGQYGQQSIATGSAPYNSIWTVSGANLAIMDGKTVVPLLRMFSAPSASLYAGVSVSAGGSYTIQSFVEIPTAGQFVVCAPIPWPPHGNRGPYGSGTLMLGLNNYSGGTVTANFDYVTLYPTDGLRQYYSSTDPVANTQTFVDNGIDGYVYHLNGSNRLPAFVTYGEPFQIIPNQAATFVVGMASTGKTMAITYTSTAKLYYRPRRFTI